LPVNGKEAAEWRTWVGKKFFSIGGGYAFSAVQDWDVLRVSNLFRSNAIQDRRV
jgi:hypothetical protein